MPKKPPSTPGKKKQPPAFKMGHIFPKKSVSDHRVPPIKGREVMHAPHPSSSRRRTVVPARKKRGIFGRIISWGKSLFRKNVSPETKKLLEERTATEKEPVKKKSPEEIREKYGRAIADGRKEGADLVSGINRLILNGETVKKMLLIRTEPKFRGLIQGIENKINQLEEGKKLIEEKMKEQPEQNPESMKEYLLGLEGHVSDHTMRGERIHQHFDEISKAIPMEDVERLKEELDVEVRNFEADDAIRDSEIHRALLPQMVNPLHTAVAKGILKYIAENKPIWIPVPPAEPSVSRPSGSISERRKQVKEIKIWNAFDQARKNYQHEVNAFKDTLTTVTAFVTDNKLSNKVLGTFIFDSSVRNFSDLADRLSLRTGAIVESKRAGTKSHAQKKQERVIKQYEKFVRRYSDVERFLRETIETLEKLPKDHKYRDSMKAKYAGSFLRTKYELGKQIANVNSRIVADAKIKPDDYNKATVLFWVLSAPSQKEILANLSKFKSISEFERALEHQALARMIKATVIDRIPEYPKEKIQEPSPEILAENMQELSGKFQKMKEERTELKEFSREFDNIYRRILENEKQKQSFINFKNFLEQQMTPAAQNLSREYFAVMKNPKHPRYRETLKAITVLWGFSSELKTQDFKSIIRGNSLDSFIKSANDLLEERGLPQKLINP